MPSALCAAQEWHRETQVLHPTLYAQAPILCRLLSCTQSGDAQHVALSESTQVARATSAHGGNPSNGDEWNETQVKYEGVSNLRD